MNYRDYKLRNYNAIERLLDVYHHCPRCGCESVSVVTVNSNDKIVYGCGTIRYNMRKDGYASHEFSPECDKDKDYDDGMFLYLKGTN